MKFWADENFNGRILKGILGVYPELDITRVQDTALMGLPDPELIVEAYQAGAILLTHDVKTLVPIAEAYLGAGNGASYRRMSSSLLGCGYLVSHSCSNTSASA